MWLYCDDCASPYHKKPFRNLNNIVRQFSSLLSVLLIWKWPPLFTNTVTKLEKQISAAPLLRLKSLPVSFFSFFPAFLWSEQQQLVVTASRSSSEYWNLERGRSEISYSQFERSWVFAVLVDAIAFTYTVPVPRGSHEEVFHPFACLTLVRIKTKKKVKYL